MKKIKSEISQAFAKGLAAGFAGKSTFEKIKRGKFSMVSSAVDDGNIQYIDQWFTGHMGGGQEIVEVNGHRFTRVYAGGTIEDGALAVLGITKAGVMGNLKENILEAGEKTRFDKLYRSENGLWLYEYEPDTLDEVTGIFGGKETISYNKTPVFVHRFLISPVIE